MSATATFAILHEVFHDHGQTGHRLCFQWGHLMYPDGSHESGYRFVWRHPPNSTTGKRNLQSARAQSRIPSIWVIRKLLSAAEAAGWGGHDADIEDGWLRPAIEEDSALAEA
jgi:hypothetical protein